MLEQLCGVLAEILPATSTVGYRMAMGSALRLGDDQASQPYWLALRSARFTWRCRLARGAGKVQFLFFFTVARISDRERLDGEITMHFRPVTDAEAKDLGGNVPLPQMVRLPACYNIRSDGKLEFRFRERSFLITFDDPKISPSGDDAPEHIQLDISPGSSWFAPGDESPWLLDTFVTFALGLARATNVGATQPVPLSPFSPQASSGKKTTLKDFLGELTDTMQTAPGLVAAGDPPDIIRQYLPLPINWRLVTAGARLGVLIDQSGALAMPNDENTFLVPCNLDLISTPEGWSMIPTLDWPDFLLRDAVREAALTAITKNADWDEAAETGAFAKLGCTPELLKGWAENEEHSVLFRVTRSKNSDTVILLLTGELRGTEVVVLFHADDVTYDFKNTETLSAETGDITLIQAAPRAKTLMNWDTKESGGKEIFCSILRGFLRWHTLVRPELAP